MYLEFNNLGKGSNSVLLFVGSTILYLDLQISRNSLCPPPCWEYSLLVLYSLGIPSKLSPTSWNFPAFFPSSPGIPSKFLPPPGISLSSTVWTFSGKAHFLVINLKHLWSHGLTGRWAWSLTCTSYFVIFVNIKSCFIWKSLTNRKILYIIVVFFYYQIAF